MSPFLILFAIFGLYPLLQSVRLSLFITNGPKSEVYVGLKNFAFLLADADFHTAVRNTLVYTFFSVFLQLPVSLGLALLLSQKWLKGREFFRLAFFMPNLVGQVFVSVLFGVLFVPQYGLINKASHLFAGTPLDLKWLSNPALVMPALVLVSLWMYVGFNMIYFLAALQAVDQELYEAARVDGANAWHQFRAVTLPGIRPVAVFVLITATIGSFQLFELPYVLLGKWRGAEQSGADDCYVSVPDGIFERGFRAGFGDWVDAGDWNFSH